jgi:cell division protein FtsI (penicillin-binding protein 3)
MNVKKSILIRVRTVFLIGSLFAIAIAYRIFHIQYVDGAEWRAKSSSFTKKVVKATRGNIYAVDGSLLATSLPLYRLGFDPSISNGKDKKLAKIFEEGVDSLALLLSQKFETYPASYYRNLLVDARHNKKKFIYLSRGFSLTYRDQQEMKTWPIFRQGKNKGGVIFEKIYKRFHPFKELAFRTVGFINEDHFGAGLEASFDQMLAGTNGQATYQQIGGGVSRPIFDGTEIRPVDGFDVVTTLDVNIQDVAESSLLNALREYREQFGCVVVMEVETGEIKAIANLGLEKPNTTMDPMAKYIEKYNYAVGRKHYPGSTFKLASYMALLEDGKIKLKDTINTGNGKLQVAKDQWIKEANNHAYGRISAKDAFAKSSNVAVAKLVLNTYKSQPEKFLQHITNFGLAEPLNFQIRGAERPFFRLPSDKKHWNNAALSKMSYGYECEITPLQTLAFYNAVANKGKMVQPIIVKEVRSNDKVAKKFEAKVIREKICSDETLAALKEMMEAVVEHPKGTGHKIKSDLYKIAGKTGTAHKFENNKWIDNSYYTSFAGFFPSDKPKYSAIVIVDSPKLGLMAGDAAAPVFKDIADKIYANDVEMHQLLAQKESSLDVPKVGAGKFEELHEICNKLKISNYEKGESKSEWVGSMTSNKAIYWKSNLLEKGKVPDVKGMSLRDAIYLIENFGYRVRTSGRGRVTSQNPKPNSQMAEGGVIMVTLG